MNIIKIVNGKLDVQPLTKQQILDMIPVTKSNKE